MNDFEQKFVLRASILSSYFLCEIFTVYYRIDAWFSIDCKSNINSKIV